MDWSRLVSSPSGLVFYPGCAHDLQRLERTVKIMQITGYLQRKIRDCSQSNSSSLWRTNTIVFAKLNKPLVSINPPPPHPLYAFEINKLPEGINRGFTVRLSFKSNSFATAKSKRNIFHSSPLS